MDGVRSRSSSWLDLNDLGAIMKADQSSENLVETMKSFNSTVFRHLKVMKMV